MSEDLREELFFKYCSGYSDSSGDSFCGVERDNAKLMLDEYWEKKAKELLEWMAQNDVYCETVKNMKKVFYYNGETISADQLFENFL